MWKRKKNADSDTNNIIIAYKYPVDLTALQEYKAENWFYVLCNLYNASIAECKEKYKNAKHSVSYSEQQNLLPAKKKNDPMLRMVYSQVLQDCVLRVDKAYRKFFDDLKRKRAGEKIKVGYPKFKKLYRYHSFTFPQVFHKQNSKFIATIKLIKGNKFGYITLPKFGIVKIRFYRNIDWDHAKTVTLKRERSGKYYICVAVEKPVMQKVIDNGKITGIDLGLKKLIATKGGEYIKHPKFIKKSERKIKRTQRILSRRKKGSSNYNKQRIKLSKLHEHVANQRKDFLHKLSLWIVLNYTYIAFENLNIKGMVKNHCLAKAILDAGWSKLINFTTYKSVMLGGSRVITVNPAYTTQDCSRCGYRVPKTLADRTHICPECGLVLDRDTNAAINICNRAFGNQKVGTERPEPVHYNNEQNVCGDSTSTYPAMDGQARSLKQKSQPGLLDG